MLTSHRLTLPPTISGLLCGFLGLIGLLCFGCKQTPRNPCGNVDQITYHGYTYGLVNIGDQCWFSENLRTSRYRSGGKITLNPEPWDLYSLGAATFFRTPTENQYDPYRLEKERISRFGRLYNWYAVNDSRCLCPQGWHVPTKNEFEILIKHLGGPTSAGNKLKSTSESWTKGRKKPHNGSTGSNSSGFSALPGGLYWLNGAGFVDDKWKAFFWTSTPHQDFSKAESVCIHSEDHLGVYVSWAVKEQGKSVRCIKDSD